MKGILLSIFFLGTVIFCCSAGTTNDCTFYLEGYIMNCTDWNSGTGEDISFTFPGKAAGTVHPGSEEWFPQFSESGAAGSVPVNFNISGKNSAGENFTDEYSFNAEYDTTTNNFTKPKPDPDFQNPSFIMPKTGGATKIIWSSYYPYLYDSAVIPTIFVFNKNYQPEKLSI